MKIDNKTIIIGYEERTNDNQVADKKWYINQCGYDVDKSKRATFTNGVRGCTFYLKDSTTDEVVFTGIIYNQIADFTKFTTVGEYYLECIGIKSYSFKIAENRIFNVSITPALKFMAQSRGDSGIDTHNTTGIGWRDSHQFSFELNSLVMMYMANPTYFKHYPKGIYHVGDCEYKELQTQTEPDIIWLIKWGVTRYHDWAVNKGMIPHAQIKGQLAYFLYLYPYITDYVTKEFYTTIRDYTISVWATDTCNKSWYDETTHHNLFATESVIGTVKGANPAGFSIVPNLMMYEVLKRDELEGYQAYFDAAYNTCEWIINKVDLDNPSTTKGQRMSEYITVTSLCYFQEMYSDTCPPLLLSKLKRLADVFISRSDNLWDFRQYRTKGDLSGATSTRWTNDYTGTGGLANQPGNTAGFASECYALARILADKDKNKRLKQLAISHLDNVFGRNPTGRHMCYKATTDFEDAKLGWFTHLNGIGNLGWCEGALDGSPKEASYPYNPSANAGYSESWVAFNTAWNMSLAYLCGENKNITDGIGIFSNKN